MKEIEFVFNFHVKRDSECFRNLSFQKFIESIDKRVHPAEENIMEIARSFLSKENAISTDDQIMSSPLSAIVTSIFFCRRAQQANTELNLNIAWTFVADASYFCGLANTAKAFFERTAWISARGGKRKSKNRLGDAFEESVRKLVKTPPEGGWRSQIHATETIYRSLTNSQRDIPISAVARTVKAMHNASEVKFLGTRQRLKR